MKKLLLVLFVALVACDFQSSEDKLSVEQEIINTAVKESLKQGAIMWHQYLRYCETVPVTKITNPTMIGQDTLQDGTIQPIMSKPDTIQEKRQPTLTDFYNVVFNSMTDSLVVYPRPVQE